jgi:hypothetical protein
MPAAVRTEYIDQFFGLPHESFFLRYTSTDRRQGFRDLFVGG